MMITILESSSGLTLRDVKEKLLKKYEKNSKKKPRRVHFAAKKEDEQCVNNESDQKVQEGSHNSVEDDTDAIRWATNNLSARQKPQEHE